jgi:hypothetical protein
MFFLPILFICLISFLWYIWPWNTLLSIKTLLLPSLYVRLGIWIPCNKGITHLHAVKDIGRYIEIGRLRLHNNKISIKQSQPLTSVWTVEIKNCVQLVHEFRLRKAHLINAENFFKKK